eukprot:TRINITY_DN14154_c0_g1_i1.p1 TRINITY_DN14154_c0_g1~~TRINITY_DN14154_c0_g1_i1.p1  ORF type:complete len:345 (-),score=68.99 TRINITY_DN14154_c0_g1_i1:75-1109(-)
MLPRYVRRDDTQSLSSLSKRQLTFFVPSAWVAPQPRSPYARTVEAAAVDWLRDIGIIRSEKTLQVVQKMELRSYACETQSMASYDRLLFYARFVALWLIWDDQVVERAQQTRDIAPGILSLAGAVSSFTDPFSRGFTALGEELHRLGASDSYRARFAAVLEEWSRIGMSEAKVQQSKQVLGFDDSFAMRELTVGSRPLNTICEWIIGVELPDEVRQHEAFAQMGTAIALLSTSLNDIAGLGRDLMKDQCTNLVVVLQHEQHLSLLDAASALLEIFHQCVMDIDASAAELLAAVAESWQERTEAYVQALRQMYSGFVHWHVTCARYREYVAVEGDCWLDCDMVIS